MNPVEQAFRNAIAAALHELEAPNGLSRDRAHEARRRLKRARAALRLLRPSLGARTFTVEDARLRACARSIAPLRDADVLIATLDRLRSRYSRSRPIDELAPLARALSARRRAAQARKVDLAQIRRELREAAEAPRVRSSNPIAAATAGKGLRRIYRRGKRARAQARAAPTAESLHRFRKQAKYFADAVEALGKAATRREVDGARHAREIGDWLGEHHDLALLRSFLRKHRERLAPAARRALRELLDARQRKLCRRALRSSRDLYAAKPRRIARGVAR